MSESFHLKTGDTAPRIEAVLRSSDEDPVDLRGSGVEFRLLEPRGGDVLVEDSVTLVDEIEGLVRYSWDEEDTAEPGRYRAEFVVHHTDDTTESFPNDGYHHVIITE
ncbi:BppU family phage baseplate upper protein [Natronolimnobius sp. AArcel1]|uniref:BppU family phage baseplate upper protein n=1 Tax=Natronolimnobius sp. AArcel1 TaxID=1679093 RepID=UPI0013EB2929|nr:BppU family phage baseplate upper protein [Natronolimnobius sp. AArcel1]NGM69187.1 BppU family phage baseplate upper protein [Natronolimnobius sp. AArcel1]